MHTFLGHASLVGLLSLHSPAPGSVEPTTLVSGAADSTLRVFDVSSRLGMETFTAPSISPPQLLHVLTETENAITCLHHDSHEILVGSDRVLRMSDTQSGKYVKDMLNNVTGVWQVVFDGRYCVAAVSRKEYDQTCLEIWDFVEDSRVGEGGKGVEEDGCWESEEEQGGSWVFVSLYRGYCVVYPT